METQTAFVRADSAVELYAITDVNLYFTVIVNPRNAECDDTLRLNKTLDKFCLFKLRMLVVDIFNRQQNFPYCL